MDINQNIAQCIQHTNNFGSTVAHNICNGTTQVVPWGTFDWVAIGGLTSFMGMMGVFMVLLFVKMALDDF